jgi:hypothetical protein
LCKTFGKIGYLQGIRRQKRGNNTRREGKRERDKGVGGRKRSSPSVLCSCFLSGFNEKLLPSAT